LARDFDRYEGAGEADQAAIAARLFVGDADGN